MTTPTRDEVMSTWRSIGKESMRFLYEQGYVRCAVRRPVELSFDPLGGVDRDPIPVAEFRYERGRLGYDPQLLERVVEVHTGIEVLGPRPFSKESSK